MIFCSGIVDIYIKACYMELEDIEKNKKVTFKAWVIELLQDERGGTSIKPVIALIGSLTLCTMMVINAVLKSTFNPSTALVDAVMIITCIGMGADSLDKFSFKGRSGEGVSQTETSTTVSGPNIGKSSGEVL